MSTWGDQEPELLKLIENYNVSYKTIGYSCSENHDINANNIPSKLYFLIHKPIFEINISKYVYSSFMPIYFTYNCFLYIYVFFFCLFRNMFKYYLQICKYMYMYLLSICNSIHLTYMCYSYMYMYLFQIYLTVCMIIYGQYIYK